MWTERGQVRALCRRVLLGGLVVLSSAECGVIRSSDWYGEVLFSLTGRVRTDGTSLSPEDLQIGMFWTRAKASGDVHYVEARTTFPANYELRIFSPPPDDAMLPLADWPEVRAAVGRPLLFEDVDFSGNWTEGDTIVGGSAEEVVLYIADEDAAVLTSAEASELRKGFQRKRAPGRPCLEGTSDLADPDGSETDLIIGDAYNWFWTWECEVAEDNPSSTGCPSPGDLAWICSRDQMPTDPVLQSCMDRHCDTIEALTQLQRLLGTCMTASDGMPCGAAAPDDLAPACARELCPRLANVPDVPTLETCPRAYEMLTNCSRRPEATGVPIACYALYCPVVAETHTR